MSVHDEYAKVILAKVLNDDADDMLIPERAVNDFEPAKAHLSKYVYRAVDVAHQIAALAVAASCDWHMHDPVPVVDLDVKQAWYRCARCGLGLEDNDVSLEGFESLESLRIRHGLAGHGPAAAPLDVPPAARNMAPSEPSLAPGACVHVVVDGGRIASLPLKRTPGGALVVELTVDHAEMLRNACAILECEPGGYR